MEKISFNQTDGESTYEETPKPIYGSRRGLIYQVSNISDSKLMSENRLERALTFLTRPGVHDASVHQQRSFLRSIGLTGEEIEEVFRRLVVATPNQVATRSSQGAVSARKGLVCGMIALIRNYLPFWFLLASGFGFGLGLKRVLQNVILPRLKAWIIEVVFKEVAVRENLDYAERAKATQELQNLRKEVKENYHHLREVLSLCEEKCKTNTSMVSSLNAHVRRLKVNTSSHGQFEGGVQGSSENARPLSTPVTSEGMSVKEFTNV